MSKKTVNKNLVKIEKNYHQLRHILNSNIGERIKLEYLRLFLSKLIDDNSTFKLSYSFFHELINDYIDLIKLRNIKYRSIQILESLNKIHSAFFKHNIKACNSEYFKNSEQILLTQKSATLIYLNEWEKAYKVLSPTIESREFARIISNIQMSNTSNKRILNTLVNSLGDSTLSNNRILHKLLGLLESEEKECSQPRNDKIWVLLIEYLTQDLISENIKDIVAIGNIQQLDVKSHMLPSKSAHDFTMFNNLSISYNDQLYQQANTAIKLAKNHLGNIISDKTNRHHVIYSFLDSHSYYSGESLGLAMTLTALANISRNNDFKYSYRLLQDYCITGSITSEGHINPIADEALEIKLSTMFYSPFNKVVIPEGNHVQAKSVIKSSHSEYKKKKIDILKGESLNDIFSNDNILVKQPTSFRTKIKKYSESKWTIPTLIIIVILLLTGLFTSFKNRNPVSLKISDHMISVSNISGDQLWQHVFLNKLDIDTYNDKNHNTTLFQFEDLNNDGKNELIFCQINHEKGYNDSLVVFSSDGEILWSFGDHPEMIFGNNKFDSSYKINQTLVNTFDGEKIIFSVFYKRPWYPTRLVAFDIDGNLVGDYWNSGVAYIRGFYDIDEDGTDEIFFGGCNNGFNKGFISVLEYDNIKGHSPQLNVDYIPRGVEKGTEKYYIKLPDPFDFLNNTKRGSVVSIQFHHNQFIVVEILSRDGIDRAYYTFNNNFEIQDFQLGDPLLHNYAKRNGHDLIYDYSKEKIKELFYDVEFWNGEQFVNYPVLSNT